MHDLHLREIRHVPSVRDRGLASINFFEPEKKTLVKFTDFLPTFATHQKASTHHLLHMLLSRRINVLCNIAAEDRKPWK